MSGLARFGLAYTDAPAAGNPKTRIEQRFRLNIDASAEADGGLTFGARVRLQADDNANGQLGSRAWSNTAGSAMFISDPRFSVSAGGLTVRVGNIEGAIQSMPGMFGGTIGFTGMSFSNVVTGFGADSFQDQGAGRNGVELVYAMGDLGVHVSHTDVTAAQAATRGTGLVAGKRTAISASYAVSGWTLALGYQDSNVPGGTDAKWVFTAGGALGSANVGFAFGQAQNGNNSMTLSGSFAVGAATTVTAYVANDEGQATKAAYGIGVTHNLGGGVSIRGGIEDAHGTTNADLGVVFNF